MDGLWNRCAISSTVNFDETAARKVKNGIADTKKYINNIPSGHSHPGASAITTWIANNPAPSGTSGWFLPSIGQQLLMVDGGIRNLIVNAGGNALDNFYWSSTEHNYDWRTYYFVQYHCNGYHNCSNTGKNRTAGQGSFRLCFGF